MEKMKITYLFTANHPLFEKILKNKYGATGRGLWDYIKDVKTQSPGAIPETVIDALGFNNKKRNELLHDGKYPTEQDVKYIIKNYKTAGNFFGVEIVNPFLTQEQTFTNVESQVHNKQNHQQATFNRGWSNAFWWAGLGSTATIIAIGMFIFLLQSSGEPQDVIAEPIPFIPVYSKKVEPVSKRVVTNQDFSPKTPLSSTSTTKTKRTNSPVTNPPPPAIFPSSKKKTEYTHTNRNRKRQFTPAAKPAQVVRVPKAPKVLFSNLLAVMNGQDHNFLNNAFEKMRSNLFYTWNNRVSGYTYEVVLQPAYSNNYGAPCRTATLRSWQEPQSRETIYKQQRIAACRDLQYTRWHIKSSGTSQKYAAN